MRGAGVEYTTVAAGVETPTVVLTGLDATTTEPNPGTGAATNISDVPQLQSNNVVIAKNTKTIFFITVWILRVEQKFLNNSLILLI